ncbi:hypothetical protein [Maritalea sp. S77]|uniref:hypothetical protein n=1 Tax=Maritalea sp. S77 TaxID=3415125 RepID=UPI003C7A4318
MHVLKQCTKIAAVATINNENRNFSFGVVDNFASSGQVAKTNVLQKREKNLPIKVAQAVAPA